MIVIELSDTILRTRLKIMAFQSYYTEFYAGSWFSPCSIIISMVIYSLRSSPVGDTRNFGPVVKLIKPLFPEYPSIAFKLKSPFPEKHETIM